jgi:ribosomal protein S18 acetylase RimI-like enzyme
MPTRPFAPEVHELGVCRLAPMDEAAAAHLGARMAAMDPWQRLGYAADRLLGYLGADSPALVRYRIDVGGELAGAMTVRWPWLHGPYLELLAVLPQAQGQGLGHALLGWLEAEAGSSRNLWVVVSAFNPRARRFYARHGFVEVGTVPGLVRDGFDEVLLRKAIG